MIPYYSIHVHRVCDREKSLSQLEQAAEENQFYQSYSPPVWTQLMSWWSGRSTEK